MRRIPIGLGLVLACSTVLGMSISDLEPGKTICGPELTVADMRDKVVFVEYWGTR